MKIAGFIGTGKMGGSLALAVLKKIGSENIALCDRDLEKARQIGGENAFVTDSSVELVSNSKFIFLGVKPQVLNETIEPLKKTLKERKDRFVIVSMLAGVTCERICSVLEMDAPIIRIMPNTSVLVGAGMTLYTHNQLVSEDEIEQFKSLLSLSGELEKLEENLIDSGMAVSGCGPAYIYLTIKALAEGGVKCGLSYETALKLARQTVLGAARLAIETETDPEQLKKDVCSKGGATIEGIYVLEDAKTNEAFQNAVIAAYEKAKKL